MNARDNLKPKTIRLAILAGLANGAITTIDDLQIKINEPRKKVAQNVYPAAIDGLIRRVRDDITGGPAYQITDAGRAYLVKYADGTNDEPSLPTCTKPQTADTPSEVEGTLFESLETVRAERDCAWGELNRIRDLINANPEESTFDEVRRLKHRPAGEIREMLRAMQYGEMTVSRGVELIEMWLAGNYTDDQLPPVTSSLGDDDFPMEIISRLTGELDAARAALELNRLANTTPIPHGYVIQRPLKPLVRFSKIENAKARALCFARKGARAQVFALVHVGMAIPGAEWRE